MEKETSILKVTSGVIEQEQQTTGLVPYVADLISLRMGFPIYTRLPSRYDEEGYPVRQNPILAYCGVGTLPLIANPDTNIGAVAIVYSDKMLVYDGQGTPPHNHRDAYRWMTPPYHYFINMHYGDVLEKFVASGFTIRRSLDVYQFGLAIFHKEPFSLGEIMNTQDVILGLSRT